VHRADNLTTFMCRLSWNLGASNSWKPQGLSGPVVGLLYLYLVSLHSCSIRNECDSVSNVLCATSEMNLILVGNTDGDGAVFICLVQEMSSIMCLKNMLEALTLRSLTLYIYGAPILDVSRSHTTTQHSR